MTEAVKMVGVTKRFGKVTANNQVDFSVYSGEIHSLVGENGAGKTTLMRILYGLYAPTEGEIYIEGEKVEFSSSLQAIKKGIGMVHQHFMLIPRLTVAENIILGSEPGSRLKLDRREAVRRIREICDRYHLAIDVEARVMDISLGMQQKVEIVKAIYRGARILILDEPTAVLTPQEIDELGIILKTMKKQGMTMIIITHKLQEVKDFSDRITVLRQGRLVTVVNTGETSIEEIAYLMVGRKVVLGGKKKSQPGLKPVFQMEGVCLREQGRELLKDISLEVRQGEILGIAGIDGSGQDILVDVINGGVKPQQGRILFDGTDVGKSRPDERRASGIGIIPQDRHRHGLALDFTIEENLVLGYQRSERYINHGFINFRKRKEWARQAVEQFDIRPENEKLPARVLSGGNQQKILISRELQLDPQLIIANQPTRGVDIGAIENIHNILTEQRERGKGLLLISMEIDELLALCDRIAVMYDGRIMGVLTSGEAVREVIGLMMVGHSREEAFASVNGKEDRDHG